MKRFLLLTAAVLTLSAGAAQAQEEAGASIGKPDLEVRLVGRNQQDIGNATLFYTPAGILMNVEVTGVSEGWHGFHIHETGTCDYDNEFKAAGGHAHAGNETHGFMVEGQPHDGDLPNIWVNETGSGKAQYFITKMSKETLDDADGSSLMLHEGPDDYKTNPSGASGGRVACGVLFPPNPAAE